MKEPPTITGAEKYQEFKLTKSHLLNKYPFKFMNTGDEIEVTFKNGYSRARHSMLSNACRNWAKKCKEETKFATKRNGNAVKVIRIK